MEENNNIDLEKLIAENNHLEIEIAKLEKEIALAKARNASKENILKTINNE